MSHVKIIFSRRQHIGSALLRTFLWSHWSHCAVVDGDEVIEAAFGKGVVCTPLNEHLDQLSHFEVVNVPVPSDHVRDNIIANMRSQLGLDYDWVGCLGLGLRTKALSDHDRWFCSELIAWAFEAANFPLLRIKPWRVSPQHLYLPVWRCEHLDIMPEPPMTPDEPLRGYPFDKNEGIAEQLLR